MFFSKITARKSFSNKGGIVLYEHILKESQKLQHEIDALSSELSAYPDGKLICCRQNNSCKWYQSDGHTKTYIPQKNRALAEQLAAKKYLSLVLEKKQEEKRALDSCLKHYPVPSDILDELLQKNSAYCDLLAPHFQPASAKLSDWMQASYEKNLQHPEHLTHKCSSGHVVRSKSEAFIDMVLHMNHIPFRYECALHLGTLTLFPDFTILHPRTGEEYYWEHFGIMDDPNYSKNAASKIHLYSSHGILPSVRLITTYESRDNPLNMEMVEEIVRFYFL